MSRLNFKCGKIRLDITEIVRILTLSFGQMGFRVRKVLNGSPARENSSILNFRIPSKSKLVVKTKQIHSDRGSIDSKTQSETGLNLLELMMLQLLLILNPSKSIENIELIENTFLSLQRGLHHQSASSNPILAISHTHYTHCHVHYPWANIIPGKLSYQVLPAM